MKFKARSKNRSFSDIFSKYWDNLIIGLIAGLVVYYGLRIQDGLKSALFIFVSALILIFLYSLFVWLGIFFNLDNKIKNLIKK